MRLKAMLLLKCSSCLKGSVFQKPFVMHPDCPECGIHFERERGYFMMSVFVGYVMGFFVVLPALGLVYLTLKPDLMGYLITAVVALLLSIPILFHYARVVWMHIDEILDPRASHDSPNSAS